MSNIQTGAERMPHDLSHLGFLAGQIGRLITISTTPVIAGDSFEMDAVGALRLSPLRRISITTILKRRGCLTVPRLTLMSLIKMMLVMVSVAAISKTFGLLRFLLRLSFLAK